MFSYKFKGSDSEDTKVERSKNIAEQYSSIMFGRSGIGSRQGRVF
ncbi:MAG: hypothetical protein QXU98_04585 [Candidatus Parvarchaeota archaeon]